MLTSAELAELFPDPDPAVFPTLTGRQMPEHVSGFPGDDHHGFDAIKLAGRIAIPPIMPWQRGNLRCLLRRDANGMWTHPDAVLIVPRQNGKSEILLLRCLYGLAVLGEKILYTVQRWDTGKDLHERLATMIASRSWLRKRLKKQPTLSQGRGTIEFTNGAKMVTSTRSADMGRGLTRIDLLIYDEAYNLDESASAAVDWAQMAAADPQTIYTSSAVNAFQHSKGFVLTDMRNEGLRGADRLYFAEYMAPAGMHWRSLPTWQYANPSWGVIANEAKIQKPLRKATTKAGIASFGVEALGRGIWPVRDEDKPALISADVWKTNKNPGATLIGPRAMAVDMTPDRKTVAITASQWTSEGRIHIDLGYHGPYSAQTVPYIVGKVLRLDPCVLVMDDQSPAASMIGDLEAAGLTVYSTNTGELAKSTGDFYDRALGALLNHTGDPDIADAVEGAVKRDLPGGGWAWDRKRAQDDISPLVAGSLSTWGLVKFGAQTAPVQKLVHRPLAPAAVMAPVSSRFGGRGLDLAAAGF
ncbi:hypothetical protein B7C42_01637 [Nocardia cerradoensis]|uniref:Phage terminase large subunit N-terminal domain-containing protein n=1 Tax=Nocardia cerradoensis TaxID=85688 RepID=A0A231HCY7_9NOCA|nr:hypothetical protein [Nocardia cerradoensis]OXR46662.1 hypothetical protein B7C42_01637 [Nocardia cerradoensis]